MKNIFWFRRDLRLNDNAGLYHALKAGKKVQAIFIFDKHILDKLQSKEDARVRFIHATIMELQQSLRALGSDLWIFYGKPEKVFKSLLAEEEIGAVYTNRDYEAYALERDKKIESICKKNSAEFHTFKDQVIFESNEILKKDQTPYTVFTPYKRRWLEKLETKKKGKNSYYFSSYPTEKYLANLATLSKAKSRSVSLGEMGFVANTDQSIPPNSVARKIIKNYKEQRDYPALNGTSRLGIHFRFGTISIREKALSAAALSDTYLSELIWRDFYSQILTHFPHVESQAFRAKYERVEWRNNEEEFKLWCAGKTGYPMVDAGMRELDVTGHMHNRVRMVVASFLTKHLLIDWRWGEAYFAEKLLDFDLASNNGGWQWAAGCGTDAAPYFRIFNPTSQLEKFDKERIYVKQWVAEWGTDEYPAPMVDHRMARERCLMAYKVALGKA